MVRNRRLLCQRCLRCPLSWSWSAADRPARARRLLRRAEPRALVALVGRPAVAGTPPEPGAPRARAALAAAARLGLAALAPLVVAVSMATAGPGLAASRRRVAGEAVHPAAPRPRAAARAGAEARVPAARPKVAPAEVARGRAAPLARAAPLVQPEPLARVARRAAARGRAISIWPRTRPARQPTAPCARSTERTTVPFTKSERGAAPRTSRCLRTVTSTYPCKIRSAPAGPAPSRSFTISRRTRTISSSRRKRFGCQMAVTR